MSVVMCGKGKGVLMHGEAPPTVYILTDLHAWKEENEAEFQGGSEEVCVCVFNWKMACVSMDFLPCSHTAKVELFAACILHPAIQSSLQYL